MTEIEPMFDADEAARRLTDKGVDIKPEWIKRHLYLVPHIRITRQRVLFTDSLLAQFIAQQTKSPTTAAETLKPVGRRTA